MSSTEQEGCACARWKGASGWGGVGRGRPASRAETVTNAPVPSFGHSLNPRRAKIGRGACLTKAERSDKRSKPGLSQPDGNPPGEHAHPTKIDQRLFPKTRRLEMLGPSPSRENGEGRCHPPETGRELCPQSQGWDSDPALPIRRSGLISRLQSGSNSLFAKPVFRHNRRGQLR